MLQLNAFILLQLFSQSLIKHFDVGEETIEVATFL